MRVFHDRLIDEEDREYLKNILSEQLPKFGLNTESVLDSERLIFGDFMQGREAEPK